MFVRLAAVAALLLVACASAPGNALAQTSAPGASAPSTDAATPKRSRSKASGTSKKEPTAGQLAARERQRKCAAEWKEAKAGGKVAAGMKWPKFWSQCNTRLKEQRA